MRTPASKRFEQDIAKDLGGRRVFASGAGFEKGDVRVKRAYKKVGSDIVPSDALTFRIEAKTTGRSTYTFKVQDWIDIRRSSSSAGENPLFAIRFLSRADFVIIHSNLAVSLGLRRSEKEWSLLPQAVSKSWSIRCEDILNQRQRTVIECDSGISRKRDVLILFPFTVFLSALETYASDW